MTVKSHMEDRGAPSAPRHPTRQAVLVAHTEAQIHETGTERIDIAVAIARAYHERVGGTHRSLSLDPEPIGTDAADYYRWAERIRKAVERWMDGSIRLPVEIEEAWVAALAEPYQARCVLDLSQRMGVFAAQIAATDEVGPAGCGAAMRASGEAISAEGPIWQDGVVDDADLASIERAETEYRQAASVMLSRAEQWRRRREALEGDRHLKAVD